MDERVLLVEDDASIREVTALGGPASRPSTSALDQPPGDPGPAPPARTLTIQVWFTRDGALFPTSRTRPYTVATSGLALAELAAGPSAPERAAGVRNSVPSDLRYEVAVADGIATVDLSGSFYGGGRDAVRLRQAQVVYSLTQFSTVSSVGFQRDGEPAGAPVGRSAEDGSRVNVVGIPVTLAPSR